MSGSFLVIKYSFGLAAGLCWFACIWVYFTGLAWIKFFPAPTVGEVFAYQWSLLVNNGLPDLNRVGNAETAGS
jgi:hypothetical protein